MLYGIPTTVCVTQSDQHISLIFYFSRKPVCCTAYVLLCVYHRQSDRCISLIFYFSRKPVCCMAYLLLCVYHRQSD